MKTLCEPTITVYGESLGLVWYSVHGGPAHGEQMLLYKNSTGTAGCFACSQPGSDTVFVHDYRVDTLTRELVHQGATGFIS